MFRAPSFTSLTFGLLIFLFAVNSTGAQNVPAPPARVLITQNIDEGNQVELRNNKRSEANSANDRGAVADNFQMEHMLLQLRRSPEQEQALQQFIGEVETKGSPNYHRWLTAQEFGARFGLAKQDLDTISRWLGSHGLKVNVVYPNGMVIDFSGTAGQVREAFKTEIHNLDVNGEKHFANMSNPRIPAALAPAVAGIVSLHDFKPQTMNKMHKTQANFTFNDLFGGTAFALVPSDLATIYNLNPLFGAGYSGQGQTIVVIEDTDIFSASDWNSFRSTLGLSSYSSGSFSTVYPAPSSGPNNCSRPGIIAPNDAEAILDAEWASAAAPNAAIVMATCADSTTTFGGLIAFQNLINASSQPPAIFSISYGQCETQNGESANAAYSAAYQQAVSEGVSVFVAAGDSGAAGCDNSVSDATHGIGVNAFASTPYNVAVGGTDFSDTYAGTNSTYWNSTNTSSFGSALSYIPEIPWNDSCAGQLITTYEAYPTPYGSNGFCNSELGGFLQTTVAGGGGPSACATGTPAVSGDVGGSCQGWPKPSWQSVLGNPNDGVRDTPDVSLFAADGLWSHYYVFCWSDTGNGGAACSGAPSGWSGAGGTSFASPIMAGIQALVNQKSGERQGNPNPTYYQLAATEYGLGGAGSCNSSNGTSVAGSCIFYDITQGDMDVNCTGAVNCYSPSGSVGVLSTSDSSYNSAYGTTTGWDFATGIGSLNAANLVNNWPSSGPNYILSASPNSLTLTQGSNGTSTITVNALNGFADNVTLSVSGLPSGVTASFSPNPANPASTLTLTASNTATIGTVYVTITGTSGSLTNATTIALSVNSVGSYSLSTSPTSVSISLGASGTSTITVTPQGGFNGPVSLSASGLPSGVTTSFSANPATTTSTLTFTASSTATLGTVPVTITGASGSLTNSATITLAVTSPPNFALSASPASLSISQGGGGASTITVTPQNGFSGAVTLSASRLPGGVSASFSPNPATSTSTLTLTATSTANTGTVALTVNGSSGNLTSTATITLTVTSPPILTVWLDQDVGSDGVPGSASYSGGAFTVKASGQYIWGTADGFNFAYQSLSGDGSIVARVVSVQGGSSSESGVMIREALTAGSKMFYSAYSGGGGTFSIFRNSTGGSTAYANTTAVVLPYWVKAVRSGNTLSSYSSPDGVNWVQIGSNQTIAMAQNVYIGLAVSSNINSALATATFDNVSVSSTAAPAPVITSVSTTSGAIGSQVVISGTGFGATQSSSAVMLNGTPMTINSWTATAITTTIPSGATSGPLAVLVAPTMNSSNPVVFTVSQPPLLSVWLDQDIGSDGVPGSVSYASGAFTVKGSGQYIWGTADGFNFAYQSLSGDGSIVARVVGVQGGSSSESGVMIREALTAVSKMSFSAYSGGGGTFSIFRNSTGGSTAYANTTAVVLPYWVKAVRSGNTLSSFSSPDGVNWVQIGSNQTIAMAQNVYIGLAVSSNINSALATATFDNVSVSSTAAPAPAITSVSATSGAIGSQVVISGTGFGATQGNSAVMLNGTPMTINSWTATSITTTIPSGATSGPLAVFVAPTMNASNSVNFTVSVVPPPNFALSTSPTSLSIAQGASGTSTITVTPQGGFNGPVSLSASGLPSGVTASFSVNPATTTSTLTFTASSTATLGTVPVTITGASGSLTNSATITLAVTSPPNFALSASPASLSISQGGGGASTITVTPQNGFSGAVTLSASRLPGGVSASFSPNPATSTSTLTLTATSTANTGTVALTVNGSSGNLTSTATITLTVTSPPILTVWLDQDVGSDGVPGSASYSGGAFTVKASGQYIWGTADGFNFAYQSLSGDGSIVARVVSVQGGSSSESGVMIREALTAGSKMFYSAYSGGGGTFSIFRNSTGGSTAYANTTAVVLPYWVKAVRSGNTLSSYSSPDGVNWVQIGSNQTIAMAQNVYIGLAVSSNINSALATATFDNVSVSSTAAPAPVITSVSTTSGAIGSQVVISGTGFGATQSSSAVMLNGTPMTINSWTATAITTTIPSGATSGPLAVLVAPTMNSSNPVVFTVSQPPLLSVWLDQDIGSDGVPGSVSYASGAFTVKGSGQYIWGTADGFNFAYQSLSGDGSIVARVVGVQGGSSSESGVMIREALTAVSKMSFSAYSGGGDIFSIYRTSTGGSTSFANTAAVTLPHWVKAIRTGNTLSSFSSPDGVNWVQIGSNQTIAMAQNVYIGLAVSSNINSALATATFDNVSLSSAAAPAPAITSVSATSGAIGSQVVISGTGFGATQGNSAVMLNGTPMTINSWTATSITTTIPSGATSGPLAVFVAPTMNASNPVKFTVTSN